MTNQKNWIDKYDIYINKIDTITHYKKEKTDIENKSFCSWIDWWRKGQIFLYTGINLGIEHSIKNLIPNGLRKLCQKTLIPKWVKGFMSLYVS